MYSKRLISLLTVVALLFSFVAVNGADYDNHWGYEYIENLVRRGIVSGDNNGRINPDNSITRAEFAKIINLFFEYTDYVEFLSNNKFNTVFYQVRCFSDALYNSSIFPTSKASPV